MLRMFVHDLARHDWDQFLPVVQLCINSTYNHSIHETPFYALFGYDSASATLNPPKFSYREDELTQHLNRIEGIRKECRKKLFKEQANYTNMANKGRKNKPIKIGQRVFAKLGKQSSEPPTKLTLPVSGPFKVLRRRGQAWILKELSTNQEYIVHADRIVGRNIIEEHEQVPPQNLDGGDYDSSSSEGESSIGSEPPKPSVKPAQVRNNPHEVNKIRKQPHRACKNGPKNYR